MKNKLIYCLILFGQLSLSQEYFPTNKGVKTKKSVYNAFVNATIYVSPNYKLEKATLIEKEGIIINYGKNINFPPNSVIHDLKGKYIYPSFIELQSNFGIKKINKTKSNNRSTQYGPSRSGYYWNDHILSDYDAIKDYSYNNNNADKIRKLGFGVVNSHRFNGIHRGTGLAIALINKSNDGNRILSQKTSEHFSFKKSNGSNQSYPSSKMGAMALIRQLNYDSNWYDLDNSETKDFSLEAIIENKKLPKFFYTNDKLDVLRAAKLSKELGLNFVIKTSGHDYEIIDELKSISINALIIPINFPKAYNVTDPSLIKKVSLRQMRIWNQAPINPSKLEKAKIPFAITSYGTKSDKEFLNNLRLAVKYGLSEETALASLTTIPSKLLGLNNKIGVLKKGYFSNFLICSGPLFNNNSVILENWVKGIRHEITSSKLVNIDGNYIINAKNSEFTINIKDSRSNINATVIDNQKNLLELEITYDKNGLFILITNPIDNSFLQLNSNIDERGFIGGKGKNNINDDITWTAIKKNILKKNDELIEKESKRKIVEITYPNNGFGFKSHPVAKETLFKNATVWTNEKKGILNKTDVLINNGKIIKIGKDIFSKSARIIDAKGKHLTSGIIDEHSHIAASSINEGGHNSSAEVTIEDVIDPDDINIYRNLAGGVTTIQILHGSANPIGGRSALIKLKWGENAEKMKYPNADKFIKFALGENVKQSNWGSYNRFPQTRMGVEQVFVDYFQRAKEYGEEWKKYNSLPKKLKSKYKAPRYDIEMETLLEIIEGKRFISCHSYIQSEINMLMKVAEKFGFRVNTFTHILEGYKIADKMKEHGVGASTFSDWWAYKFEVNDAIPYNGSIMHNVGVIVAFNSDSAEMSRRLNQEAAKAVKYGNISEEEAWKFVTLNPAKLLHIENKVGSIKVGKDADLVLWSDHPLSIYSIAEKTMIDGVFYYEESDLSNQLNSIDIERKLLIEQMIKYKNESEGNQIPVNSSKQIFKCETLD